MWYVYMLFCDERIFYVGITNDFAKRIKQHQSGKSFFTKKFSRTQLVYGEKYPTKYLAAAREKQLKGWSRAKKQMLIGGELGMNVCTELLKSLGG